MTTTTFNPSDKDTKITLSGGNLTASSSAAYGLVRGTTSHASGKWYFEETVFVAGGIGDCGFGVATASEALTNWVGQTTQSVSIWNDGNIYLNGASLGSTTAPANGDTYGFCIDIDAKKLFIRSGGGWVIGGNPDSGGAGISIAGLASFTLFPAFSGASGGSSTANYGASAFTLGQPTSAKPWDDHITLTPAKGHLAFTGYAPATTAAQSVSPGKGHLSFTGYAPSVSTSTTVTLTPGAGHISFTGYAPTLTIASGGGVDEPDDPRYLRAWQIQQRARVLADQRQKADEAALAEQSEPEPEAEPEAVAPIARKVARPRLTMRPLASPVAFKAPIVEPVKIDWEADDEEALLWLA